MAIKKKIIQDDGVTTEYHRILYVMSSVNSHISIAVASYVDEDIRDKEINGTVSSPYIKSKTYETEYVENMTIAEAYNYLKTLEEFENAEDI